MEADKLAAMAVMLKQIGKKDHFPMLSGLRRASERMIFFANFFEPIGDWIAAAVAGNWLPKHVFA